MYVKRITPYLEKKSWAGNFLKKYSITNEEGIGEVWIFSSIKNKECLIENIKLSEFFKNNKKFFHNKDFDEIPILIKFLNAGDKLSLQVHPSDEMALKKHGQKFGKNEAWYFLDLDQNAQVIYGTKAKNKEELRSLVDQKKWDQIIQYVDVKKHDVIDVKAGTIHGIEKNSFVYEIQQSSDITYRFYDYDRLVDNKPRELHLEEALEASTNFEKNQKNTKHLVSENLEQLVTNNNFSLYRIFAKDELDFLFDLKWFSVITSIEKNPIEINGIKLDYGQSVLVSHLQKNLKIKGEKINLLWARID
ncbi:MANNOSE-6-PHOSPHATE ISOMERASE (PHOSPHOMANNOSE ISOMERASE) (PMI) (PHOSPHOHEXOMUTASE) [Mycoplasmopsis pulmonis]|uniref:MANNOSE-6-PHOSPHATE ISOMERASE (PHOSPHOMANNOSE ISOMERASE) (PMI) (PHOSPHOHEXOMUTASE) n=1 Tax=Mycoplasmopsis pulmonis (strain UAB CTIP) TaxID=272635 RepID=Q98PJ7_MYCPU|nr:type I phosphomannose isomerase catalytic subunit [Mycoplasmopsis pulmonis]MDZ7293423.1 class I mannose-6-phosphate isomerase [Mycoplasmopsis pulmonis]CAC13898.1 MANNOSE-6-PHOSPHATE ISOMERASE (PHOSPHOMANNOSE ISOMERASE) (PMI) (PHOSPHOHEXOMUTASE) [Mycoplasmopsis pulmonis]